MDEDEDDFLENDEKTEEMDPRQLKDEIDKIKEEISKKERLIKKFMSEMEEMEDDTSLKKDERNSMVRSLQEKYAKVQTQIVRRKEKIFVKTSIFDKDYFLNSSKDLLRLIIEVVDLTLKNITDEDVDKICEILPDCEALRKLYLSMNKITDKGAIALSEKLHHAKNLTNLYLSYNKITDTGAIAIAKALPLLPSLTYLSLPGGRSIGKKGKDAISYVPNVYAKNLKVEYFELT